MTTSGPFVNCAFICERALLEQDQVMSAVRIVDQLTVPALAPDALFPTALTLVVNLKSGGFKGKAKITCDLRSDEDPTPRPVFSLDVEYDGTPNQGMNVMFGLKSFKARTRWLFFDVRVNGALVTVVPFRVIVEGASPS